MPAPSLQKGGGLRQRPWQSQDLLKTTMSLLNRSAQSCSNNFTQSTLWSLLSKAVTKYGKEVVTFTRDIDVIPRSWHKIVTLTWWRFLPPLLYFLLSIPHDLFKSSRLTNLEPRDYLTRSLTPRGFSEIDISCTSVWDRAHTWCRPKLIPDNGSRSK